MERRVTSFEYYHEIATTTYENKSILKTMGLQTYREIVEKGLHDKNNSGEPHAE